MSSAWNSIAYFFRLPFNIQWVSQCTKTSWIDTDPVLENLPRPNTALCAA
jgi:hypothetical protein